MCTTFHCWFSEEALFSSKESQLFKVATQHYNISITILSVSSDGAPACSKNHFNMINLRHHQHDFNMSVSWTFSVSGHSKSPCDDVGAAVKSSTNRSVLLCDTVISCVEDFFNFTKKNEDAAKLSQTKEPPIKFCYLKYDDIERVTENLLGELWNKNNGKNFLLLQQTHTFVD